MAEGGDGLVQCKFVMFFWMWILLAPQTGDFCFCMADADISKDIQHFCWQFYVGFGGVKNQISNLLMQKFRAMLGGGRGLLQAQRPRHPGHGPPERPERGAFCRLGPHGKAGDEGVQSQQWSWQVQGGSAAPIECNP